MEKKKPIKHPPKKRGRPPKIKRSDLSKPPMTEEEMVKSMVDTELQDIKKQRVAKKLTKQHKDFLVRFAMTHNKARSVIEAGLGKTKDGGVKDWGNLNIEANIILRNPVAQQYLTELHRDIFKAGVHTLEKAIEESYNFYLQLKEQKSNREANVAYDRYVMLCGFARVQPQVSINTQYVSDKPITINYVKPDENNNITNE